VPTKPYTTVQQQLTILNSRGIELGDDAERWLGVVTYYRLSGYAYPYRVINDVGPPVKRGDDYEAGTRLEYVTRLYEFDRKLRTLLFDGLERVEVALRRGIADIIGKNDPLGYRDASLFRDSFAHADWLDTVHTKRLAKARRRDAAIKHHFEKYGGECPIWVAVDALDFSDASRLFEGLRARDQFQVAEAIGIRIDLSVLSRRQRTKVTSHHPMGRWLEQATVARNIAAHHGRLWNRGLAPANGTAMRTVRGLEGVPAGQSESVFGLLCFVSVVLETTSPGSTWINKVRTLIETELLSIPGRTAAEMGAPEGWRSLPMWRE